MTKKQRMLELAKLVLAERGLSFDAILTSADCLMAMPDRHVPDMLSLRHFVFDVLDLLLGQSDRCDVHHPKAARWVRRWRKVWWPREALAGRPDATWTTDARLRYRTLTGPVPDAKEGLAERFVGKTVYEALGEMDPDHRLVALHEAALRGETRATHAYIDDGVQYITVAPRMSKGRVVGVVGTTVRLPKADLVDGLADEGKWAPFYALLDRELRYVSLNGPGLAAVGLAEGDVAGKTAEEFWAGHPQGAEVLAVMRRALSGETAQGVIEFDGRTSKFLCMPRYDPDGLVLMGVAAVVVVADGLVRKDPDWLKQYGGRKAQKN